MKRAVGILSIAASAVCASSLAFAQAGFGTGIPGSGRETSGTSNAGFMGQHMMTGTVKSVDKTAGTVTIDADGKQLDLRFPQTALQNLNTGDRVTVQVAIRKAPEAGTSGVGAGMDGGSGTSGTRGAEPGSGIPGARDDGGDMETGTGGGMR